MSLSIHDPLEGTPFAMQVAERVEKKVKRVNQNKGDILAEIARLRAENEALRAKKAVKAPDKASCVCDKTSTLPDKCQQIDTKQEEVVKEPVTAEPPAKPSNEMTIEQVAQRQLINGGRSGMLVDLKSCGHHMVTDDGTVYADTSFLYAADKVSGSELKHLGFGDFKATYDGKDIEFVRYDDYPIPGKVGRAHQVRGDAQAIKSMLAQCIERGLSLDMTGIVLVESPVVSVVETVSPPVEETKPAEIVPVEETTTVVEVSFKPEPEQKQVRDTDGWPAWRKRMYGIK